MPPKEAAKLTAVETPPATPAPESPPAAQLCSTCGQRPRSENSTRCKVCLAEPLKRPETKAKRAASCAVTTGAAYALLKRFKAGELVAVEERYAEIFGLVPDLEDKLRRRAAANLRSLAAELAVILRAGLEP
ncbi:MAG: hypothetical protein PHZ19_08020 [Candidatus Thermoplasmatota archaeon]|nr:hypothetical protein [Candidatus Thermoplasmatota archaeon]